jgi:hypothetical protein
MGPPAASRWVWAPPANPPDGAVNRVAARPDTSAQFNVKGVKARLRRGASASIAFEARHPLVNIAASGRIEPPSGRREVVVSQVADQSRPLFSSFPRVVRVFNTQSGELRYEVHPGLKFGPFVNIEEGQHGID